MLLDDIFIFPLRISLSLSLSKHNDRFSPDADIASTSCHKAQCNSNTILVKKKKKRWHGISKAELVMKLTLEL